MYTKRATAETKEIAISVSPTHLVHENRAAEAQKKKHSRTSLPYPLACIPVAPSLTVESYRHLLPPPLPRAAPKRNSERAKEKHGPRFRPPDPLACTLNVPPSTEERRQKRHYCPSSRECRPPKNTTRSGFRPLDMHTKALPLRVEKRRYPLFLPQHPVRKT